MHVQLEPFPVLPSSKDESFQKTILQSVSYKECRKLKDICHVITRSFKDWRGPEVTLKLWSLAYHPHTHTHTCWYKGGMKKNHCLLENQTHKSVRIGVKQIMQKTALQSILHHILQRYWHRTWIWTIRHIALLQQKAEYKYMYVRTRAPNCTFKIQINFFQSQE